MADKTSKTKYKRLPKSQRIHIRHLKEAARKAGQTYHPPTSIRIKIKEETDK